MQADLAGSNALATLFAEELGLMLEVDPQHEQAVLDAYSCAGLQPASIGSVLADSSISISVSGQPAISGMYFSMISGHHVRHLHVHGVKFRHHGRHCPSAWRLCMMCRSTVYCVCRESKVHHEHIHSVHSSCQGNIYATQGCHLQERLHVYPCWLQVGKRLPVMRQFCPVLAGMIRIDL